MIYIKFWLKRLWAPIDLPKSDVIIPIEHIHGFDLDKQLNFKQSQYKDLWEITNHYGFAYKHETICIDPPTHMSIVVILYKHGRYYVIARADQYKQFFDITSLFKSLRPLCFKDD
ncbi:MAG TPA: hypothetical protein PKD85_05165 [Saprospiraceae bacterium]|nr:hypothetical protein [Saprospiraceae bacterium]